MARQGVLSERELRARYEISLERYIKDITVEARLTQEIGRTLILPAVSQAQGSLADTALKLRQLDQPVDTSTLAEVSRLTVSLQEELNQLAEISHEAEAHHACRADHARYMREKVMPAMKRVRELADALEGLVDDTLWPLPTYQELLFIR